VGDAPVHHGHPDRDRVNVLRLDVEQVLIEHGDVGVLARLQRPILSSSRSWYAPLMV
jgi:hypothetical protein